MAPLSDDELDRSNRQPHSAHLKVRVGENKPIPLKEEDFSKKGQRRGGDSMIYMYKSKRIDLEEKN